jgi:hypothetical protein
MLKSNIFYESHKLPNNSTKCSMKRYDIGIQLKRQRRDDSNNSFEDLLRGEGTISTRLDFIPLGFKVEIFM